MKRVAIFASYNKQGIISEYVLYYLRGLREVADCIIFIADNEVSASEQKKLEGIVIYKECKRHGCYDFGSYRRGFNWAEVNGLLDDAEELIFCNDSCYGPVFPFENVFAEMQKKECDFWGMAESHEIKKHLQSYFLVFKKNVFSSQSFREYVYSFEKQDGFWSYVKKYETNFAGHLSEAGFKYASYIDSSKYEKLNNDRPINPTIFPLTTLRDGMPLIKRKIFGCQYCFVMKDMPDDVVNFIKSKNSDIYEIIMRDVGKDTTEMHRPIVEEMCRLRKHAKNLEDIQSTQQKHIDNLEKIRNGQQYHIAQLEKIQVDQQKNIENLRYFVDEKESKNQEYLRQIRAMTLKNQKHLRQIWALVALCIVLLTVLILSLFV